MNEITTTDRSKFGLREKEMAEELLKASREQGFPDEFNASNVMIMMNMMSGNVFFTNDDCQVAMMSDDKLEMFYTCLNCGNEGFAEEFFKEGTRKCQECGEEI